MSSDLNYLIRRLEISNISGIQKTILATIALYYFDKNYAWMSNDLLVKETGFCLRAIMINLKILEQLGLIISYLPSDGFRTKRYQIQFEKLLLSTDGVHELGEFDRWRVASDARGGSMGCYLGWHEMPSIETSFNVIKLASNSDEQKMTEVQNITPPSSVNFQLNNDQTQKCLAKGLNPNSELKKFIAWNLKKKKIGNGDDSGWPQNPSAAFDEWIEMANEKYTWTDNEDCRLNSRNLPTRPQPPEFKSEGPFLITDEGLQSANKHISELLSILEEKPDNIAKKANGAAT